MFKQVLAATLATTLLFGTVACQSQVQPVPVVVDQNIETTFTALNAGMLALLFVPGLPPIVVTQAKAALAALQTAYNTYKNADPSQTQYQAALQSAISAAQQFLASQQASLAKKAVTLHVQ